MTKTGTRFDDEINEVIPLLFEVSDGFLLCRCGFVDISSRSGTDKNRIMFFKVLDDLRIQIQFLHPFDRFGFLHLASRIRIHFHLLFLLLVLA